ncbi:MAG TPA: M56 family metallopeptidase [Bryobacteraceae bacterium]|nr:M56 family metallopeptidase [Bryobacteraceae bacterium]
MNPAIWQPLANHLWQTTIFAAVVWMLAAALTRNGARIRYWLWLVASLKFLIPFSLLVGIGRQFELRTTAVVPHLTSAIGRASQPFEALTPVIMTVRPEHDSISTTAVLLSIWFCGTLFVFTRWWMAWRRMRIAACCGSPLTIQAPIRVVSSPKRIEPGVFGIARPVLLLPEGIADRLTPAQFRAILAHEFCHVRRRDNLTAAFHMVVEGLFWFHPLAWWIGRRLTVERERACDEEVLRLGNEPEEYAAGILNVCKHYVESRLACAAGLTSADLKKRIVDIMTCRALPTLTFAKRILIASVGFAAIAIPTIFGVLGVGGIRAQLPERFEVAAIKLSKSTGGMHMLQTLPGGGIRLGGETLKGLISMAYGVEESRISGGPSWIGSTGFDIVAKPEQGDTAEAQPAPGTRAWARMQQRLRTLLEERFQLKIHEVSKDANIYALIFVKKGPKLKPAERDDIPPGTMRDRTQITGRAGTMQMLATVLSNMLRRPVEDRTGLTGKYDYVLEYAPEPEGFGHADDPPDGESRGPSVFTALQEQLGLKLESVKGSIVDLVIDRAEKPSNN